MKCVIQGNVSGKRRHGRHNTSYSRYLPTSQNRWVEVLNKSHGTRGIVLVGLDGEHVRGAAVVLAADHHSWWDGEGKKKTKC